MGRGDNRGRGGVVIRLRQDTIERAHCAYCGAARAERLEHHLYLWCLVHSNTQPVLHGQQFESVSEANTLLWDVIRAKTTPHIVYDAHHTQNCTVWGPNRCKSGPHTGRMCRSCQNSRRHTDIISKFLYCFIIRRSSLFLVYNNMATLWTCLRGKFFIF